MKFHETPAEYFSSQLQHNFKPIIRHTDIAARCEKASELLEKEAEDA